MGVGSAVGGMGRGVAGILQALSKPIFSRTTKKYVRKKNGLDRTITDTWSISIGDAIFIWLLIAAIKLINESKDLPADQQADILMGMWVAGPIGALAGTLGIGPTQQTKLELSFFRSVIDIAKNLAPTFYL